jgi:hypothetical protein
MSESIRRKVGAYICLFCVFGMMVLQQRAYAQAQPVANFVVNRAMAGVITRVALARGFAANDPRIAATLVGVGKVSTELNVAATVAGVGMSIAGAPVWMTIAAGLGIVAAGSAIYGYLSNRDSMALGIEKNRLVVRKPESAGAPYVPTGAVIPGNWGRYLQNGSSIYRTSACMSSDPCAGLPAFPSPAPNFSYTAGEYAVGADTLDEMAAWQKQVSEEQYGVGNVSNVFMYWAQSADGNSFRLARYVQAVDSSGQAINAASWADYVTVKPGLAPVAAPSLDALTSVIGDDVRSAKLDEMSLAELADRAWMRAASQPGYQGLPYDAAQPITWTDASGWINANPNAVPSVGDLLAPANAPGSQVVPIGVAVTPESSTENPTTPGAATDVNVVNTPNVNIVNTVKVDFGADPNVGSPALETTPSGAQILQPLTSLFPEFRSFQTPQHVGTCPKPAFDVFGKTIVMDAQCTIAEQHRAVLASVMMVVWLLVGLFILLSA